MSDPTEVLKQLTEKALKAVRDAIEESADLGIGELESLEHFHEEFEAEIAGWDMRVQELHEELKSEDEAYAEDRPEEFGEEDPESRETP